MAGESALTIIGNLTADPELKAKTGYCGVNVWFNHGAGGSYTL